MSKAIIETLLTANNSNFKAGISGADSSVGKFSRGNISKVAGIIAGAFAVRAVVNFAKEMMSTADTIDNLSTRLNMSTDSVQTLQKVASDAGFEFGKFESAIIKSNAAQAEAVTENGMMRKSFEKMGISIDALKKMSPEETFKTLSEVMATNGDDMQVLDGYYEIFGKRAGGTLIESMKMLGDEGFDNLTQKMIDQNRILDSESIDILDRYEQKLKETGETARNFFAMALAKTAGGFEYLGKTIKGVVWDQKSFADASSDAADSVFGVNEDLRMLTKTELETRKKTQELTKANEELAKAQEEVKKGASKEEKEIDKLKNKVSELTAELDQASAQDIKIEIPEFTDHQLQIWAKFFNTVSDFSDAKIDIGIELPHMTYQQVRIWESFLNLWRYAQADVKIDLNVPHMTNQQVKIWKSFFDEINKAGLKNLNLGFDTLTKERMAEVLGFYRLVGIEANAISAGFGDLQKGIPIDVSALQEIGIGDIAKSLKILAELKGFIWT